MCRQRGEALCKKAGWGILSCRLSANGLHRTMIRLFRNKELQNLWEGKRSRIDARFQTRIPRRLDALAAASVAEDVNLPGFNFHGLLGFNPTRYTIHVNGPWSITFEFDAGDAQRVDFEQYHQEDANDLSRSRTLPDASG